MSGIVRQQPSSTREVGLCQRRQRSDDQGSQLHQCLQQGANEEGLSLSNLISQLLEVAVGD